MAKKPANLKYSVNDKVPFGNLVGLSFQHIIAMSSILILPVIVASSAHLASSSVLSFVQMSMIAIGLGSILMGFRHKLFAPGYLAPLLCAPAYFTAAVAAVKTGGLSLLFGMTLVASVFQGIMASIITKLKKLFPAEIMGIVVAMIGLSLIPTAFKDATGVTNVVSHVWHGKDLFVTFLTLAVMVGLTVWGKGILFSLNLVIGSIVGFVAAYYFQLFTPADFHAVSQSSWLGFPHHLGVTHLSFSWVMLVPFLIAGVTVTLKDMGTLLTCQKINDAEWKHPDMQPIRRGLFANAISNVVASLLGGYPNSLSSSNVGLSLATANTSRFVGMGAGALYIIIAFIPKVVILFTILPHPVISAILFYVATFMIVTGMQIMFSRMLDARKIFVIGLSIMAGLIVEMEPTSFSHLPSMIKPFFGSPLSATVIVAVVLNLLFRIGVSKSATLGLQLGSNVSSAIWDFMEVQGRKWGALPETVHHASSFITEAMEAIQALSLTSSEVKAEVSYDDHDMSIELHYQGPSLELDVKLPDVASLRRDAAAAQQLSIFLMKNHAKNIKVTNPHGDYHVLCGTVTFI